MLHRKSKPLLLNRWVHLRWDNMAKTKGTAGVSKSKTILLKIGGVPIYWDGEMISYTGEMTCCADGSPRAYGPEGCDPEPLDYLGNAGYPGNWWGVTTDKYGQPYVQQESSNDQMHPYPGLYISCTAYCYSAYPEYDCRRWVNPEIVDFSVIPSNVRSAVGPKFMGCRAEITQVKTGKKLDCVCAEIGPSNHLGEASMSACEFFELSSDPKDGGSSDKKGFLYRFWPGVPAEGWKLI
jgi:hypothetical protein